MDIVAWPSDAREDRPIGTAADVDEDDCVLEGEEQHDEAFEATLLWLDQQAAERLVALASS